MSNEEKLVKMLKYVSEHNDFYKNRIKEYGIKNPLDITQWPILTRKELQENRYNMFSDGYKSKYFNQQLRRQSSSGSTGMPVNVYWDYKDWYASNMCLWRKRYEWYGIKPSDRYVMFTLNAFGLTPEEGKLYYINDPSNVMSFNLSLIRNETGYEQMAEIINSFKPDWLYIQPFVLNQLIQAYKKLNLDPTKSIRYIESVGEILTSDLRRRAEELFHFKVTNMYGSEEMNGIAIGNPNGDMHILTDNVFIEVNNEEGTFYHGDGAAIITNLNNYAMPLIRYSQGDTITAFRSIDAQNCESIIIGTIHGRVYETIALNNTVAISSFMLQEIIAEVNNQFGDIITEYRFEYLESKKNILCVICIRNEKWNVAVKKALIEAFDKKISCSDRVMFEILSISSPVLEKQPLKNITVKRK